MDFKLLNKIEIAAGLINRGKVIIVPTDTVYGIAAGFNSLDAQKKIFQIKQRPYTMPLIALIASWESLSMLVSEIPATSMRLIDQFWPGGLTIIFNKKPGIAVNPQTNTIGVRWCDNEILNHLIEECEEPLLVTSANLSGQPAPTMVSEIEQPIIAAVDFLIDGGVTQQTEESTVVDVTDGNNIIIIREGAIPKSAIFSERKLDEENG